MRQIEVQHQSSDGCVRYCLIIACDVIKIYIFEKQILKLKNNKTEVNIATFQGSRDTKIKNFKMFNVFIVDYNY